MSFTDSFHPQINFYLLLIRLAAVMKPLLFWAPVSPLITRNFCSQMILGLKSPSGFIICSLHILLVCNPLLHSQCLALSLSRSVKCPSSCQLLFTDLLPLTTRCRDLILYSVWTKCQHCLCGWPWAGEQKKDHVTHLMPFLPPSLAPVGFNLFLCLLFESLQTVLVNHV